MDRSKERVTSHLMEPPSLRREIRAPALKGGLGRGRGCERTCAAVAAAQPSAIQLECDGFDASDGRCMAAAAAAAHAAQ